MKNKMNHTVILNYIILLLGVWGCFVGVSRFNLLPLVILVGAGIFAIFRNKHLRKFPEVVCNEGTVKISAVADIVTFGLVPVYIAYNHSPRYSIFIAGVIYIVVFATRLFYLDTIKNTVRRLPLQSIAFFMALLNIYRVHFSSITEKSTEIFILNSIFLTTMSVLLLVKLPQKKFVN